ncbi:MAG TPA: serine hydrolase [Terriglobales bacterium]|nr:serine hydrolase [Terriglobales bacterium]
MSRILTFTVLILSSIAGAQMSQLSPEQKEVWQGEEKYFRYLEEKDLKGYMSLWDDRFVGWRDYELLPVRKAEIESSTRQEFESKQGPGPPLPSPKPEAITVFGNVAITDYFWPEADTTSQYIYRITHTWQKGPGGWHIIGGMSSEVPRFRTAIANPVPGDDALSQKVDEAVAKLMHEMKIPGTSVAVVRDGKIIKATGYGMANVELNVPVTPQTIFQAGSTGKQFTAAAILLLAEEGKLSLDDSVTKYFPEAPPWWKPITIRHLLAHTSGLPDIWGETEGGSYTKALVDMRRDYTEDELLRVYVKMKPQFQPGEKWEYSNTGYQILGILIRRLTGKSHSDFIRERIFQPLGMDTARVISESDIVPNRSSGYMLVKGELKNQEWIAPSLNTTADGPYYMTVLDLAKWDASLYTEKILKRTSLEQMWTVQAKLNSGKTYRYGLGWFLADVNGHRLTYHTGGNQGFFVNISRYVDDRLTVIVMNNMDEDHCDTLQISGAIASIYIPATKGKNPIKDW